MKPEWARVCAVRPCVNSREKRPKHNLFYFQFLFCCFFLSFAIFVCQPMWCILVCGRPTEWTAATTTTTNQKIETRRDSSEYAWKPIERLLLLLLQTYVIGLSGVGVSSMCVAVAVAPCLRLSVCVSLIFFSSSVSMYCDAFTFICDIIHVHRTKRKKKKTHFYVFSIYLYLDFIPRCDCAITKFSIYRSKTHACTRSQTPNRVTDYIGLKQHTHTHTILVLDLDGGLWRVVFTFNWIDASAKRILDETEMQCVWIR